MHYTKNNIGALLSVLAAINAQSVNASSDVNGETLDRCPAGQQVFDSCVVQAAVGAVTGGPSAQTHRFKVEESADGSTWSDAEDLDGTALTLTITAADTIATLNINLQPLQRYIRVVYDSANSSFTDGTSPSALVSASVVMGGAKQVPV